MSDYQKVEIIREEGQDPAMQGEENFEQEAPTEEQAQYVEEQRPEWLPEKFESAEDMAKAYSELEANYTKSRQNSPEGEEANKETASSSEPLSLESFAQYEEEFNNNGDISEESRNAITEMGIPREMVDAYIEGQKSMVSQQFDEVYGEVGGEENYNRMLEWAAENLPEGEQQAFNDAVVTGSPDQMMFAIKSLSSRWQSSGAAGQTPLIQGNTGSVNSSGGFRSLSELTAAMKDPRYQKDPAYRKDIETRLGNSNVL